MLRDGTPAAAYPLETWGYQEVGRVDAVGDDIDAVARAPIVWGAWSHRGSALFVGHAAARQRLPDDAASVHGIFARIGAAALNAVLDANVQLGEHVAVFGLGVPGLLAVQLARRGGGRVTAVDHVPRRLALAAELGAYQLRRHPCRDAARRSGAAPGGRGADVSIELTGSYAALIDVSDRSSPDRPATEQPIHSGDVRHDVGRGKPA